MDLPLLSMTRALSASSCFVVGFSNKSQEKVIDRQLIIKLPSPGGAPEMMMMMIRELYTELMINRGGRAPTQTDHTAERESDGLREETDCLE